MNCSPNDLRDYLLGELAAAARSGVETHVRGCAACREELERLQATRAALLTLPDEEMPQRIAFVSDRVYEPSPVRRWWRALWDSGPRLGFASAAMLSAAILTAALLWRPAPAAPAAVDRAVIEAEVSQRVAVAVEKAMAESEQKTARLLAASDQQIQKQREQDLVAIDRGFEVLSKTVQSVHRAAYYRVGQ